MVTRIELLLCHHLVVINSNFYSTLLNYDLINEVFITSNYSKLFNVAHPNFFEKFTPWITQRANISEVPDPSALAWSHAKIWAKNIA